MNENNPLGMRGLELVELATHDAAPIGALLKSLGFSRAKRHATMAVDVLINQYTEACRHVPILVYENNGFMRIYEDRESVNNRNKRCFLCNI